MARPPTLLHLPPLPLPCPPPQVAVEDTCHRPTVTAALHQRQAGGAGGGVAGRQAGVGTGWGSRLGKKREGGFRFWDFGFWTGGKGGRRER